MIITSYDHDHAALDCIYLAIAASLDLINIELMIAMQIGLLRRLPNAAVRMVVQLGVVGFVL